MSCRQILFCINRSLLAIVVVAVSSPHVSGEDAYLRGEPVHREQFVFATVTKSEPTTARINLGYAHGVLPGDLFIIVRNNGDDHYPVSAFQVTETAPESARGRVEGPFKVLEGDVAIIRAEKLDLWDKDRQDDYVLKNSARRRGSPGYTTLDLSPRLAAEVGRDNDYRVLSGMDLTFRGTVRESSQVGKLLLKPTGIVTGHTRADATKVGEIIPEHEFNDTSRMSLNRLIEIAGDKGRMIERLPTSTLVDQATLKGTPVNFDSGPAIRKVLIGWTQKVLIP